MGAVQCKIDHTSSNRRLVIRGPRQRQHGSRLQKPTMWPRATVHQCVSTEGKDQDAVTRQKEKKKKKKKRTPGKIRRDLYSSFYKTIDIPSGQGTSGEPSIMGSGRAMPSIGCP